MSTVKSLWNEQGRQKLSDRETDERTQQVKPEGEVQSAEPIQARDHGKSDERVWEAVFSRENMQTALKRVESNKGAAGIDAMKVADLRGYLKAHWLEVRAVLERATRAKFLGFSFWKRKGEVYIRLANRTKERLAEKIRRLTKRSRSGKMEDIVDEINRYLRGWMGYFRLASTLRVDQKLDEWIRRGLRQMQWKRGTTRYRELVKLGVSRETAALGAIGTSPWQMSHSPIIHEALNNAYWQSTGLERITERYNQVRYSR